MGFSPANLVKRPNVLKIPLLVFSLSVMLMARCGRSKKLDVDVGFGLDSNYLGWYDLESDKIDVIDMTNFCVMVGYGTIYILLVQMVSILFGERWPVMVRGTWYDYWKEATSYFNFPE